MDQSKYKKAKKDDITQNNCRKNTYIIKNVREYYNFSLFTNKKASTRYKRKELKIIEKF